MTLTKIVIFFGLWYFIGFGWTLALFGAYLFGKYVLKQILGTPADRTRAYLRSLE